MYKRLYSLADYQGLYPSDFSTLLPLGLDVLEENAIVICECLCARAASLCGLTGGFLLAMSAILVLGTSAVGPRGTFALSDDGGSQSETLIGCDTWED